MDAVRKPYRILSCLFVLLFARSPAHAQDTMPSPA